MHTLILGAQSASLGRAAGKSAKRSQPASGHRRGSPTQAALSGDEMRYVGATWGVRRIATSRCVMILSCLGRVAFRAACPPTGRGVCHGAHCGQGPVLAILAMLVRHGRTARGSGWLRSSHLLRCAPWLGPIRSGRESRLADRTGKQALWWGRLCESETVFPACIKLTFQRHSKPSPLFDPPEAGRLSGRPLSRRHFAATARRSGQGMKPHSGARRGARPLTVPSTVAPVTSV